MIKFISFSFVLLSFSFNGIGQTVFWNETFQASAAPKGTNAHNYVGDEGTWTVENTGANGASANNWYVSGEECGNAVGTCGSACPNVDHTLHISAIGGLCFAGADCGAAYDETSILNQTNKRAMSPLIDCSGNYNLELNFEYIAAQQDDGFWVEYSTNGGGTWTTFTGGNVAESQCCCLLPGFCGGPDPITCAHVFSGQGYWAAANLTFPNTADNNANVKIAFHWSNDGNGVGTDPSVAIDNITITHATVLGAELKSFEGSARENINTLDWSTASEYDPSHFEIEHSTNGEYYTSIGIVSNSHRNSTTNYFSYNHQVETETNYYRLKTIEKDGSKSYSEPIKLTNDLSQIYLDRQHSTFVLRGFDHEQGEVSFYDLNGKQVRQTILISRTDSELPFTLEKLDAGIYVVQVITDKTKKSFKIAAP